MAAHRCPARRALAAGALLRPVSQRRRGARNAQPDAQAVPAAQLRGQRVPQPVAALPAISDRAMQRAVRGPGARGRLQRCGASRHHVPGGTKRGADRRAWPRHGGRQPGAGFRARRAHPRPAGFDPHGAGAPVCRWQRSRARRAGLRARWRARLRDAAVLPRWSQPRHAQLFPQAQRRRQRRRSAGRVRLAVLRRADAAPRDRA